MPKESEELQPWNPIALTVSHPKLNFLLCRMLLVEMETGRAEKGREKGGGGWGAFFESLNLYGLLRYQALRTRSDADTFVEGWQISCPSRCLIAWPLFTKWWWWKGGVTAVNGARVNEGPAQEMHISPRLLVLAFAMSIMEDSQEPIILPKYLKIQKTSLSIT